MWLSNVNCVGVENKLANCGHAGWGVVNCNRDENVKIKCNNGNEGDVRMSSGKLQILHNDEWGRVCSDNFGRIEAQVACQQLGYRNGSVLQTPEATSTQKIWLNILKCNGGESKLIDCSHIDWEQDICSHGNVVGIRCYERQGSYCLYSINTHVKVVVFQTVK
ncbi:unnamed protein product [Mytilus edulis]|uniref:SRCR domain-containing protein n=1 Tax=Mytilus edulis TaxID=6550 RepID=A0A8S3Q2H4_MYTED|nr:unnamed protein product [Mytilus edulis]